MQRSFTRREFMQISGALVAAGALMATGVPLAWAEDDELSRALEDTEARLGARLGASILDTETGNLWQHRNGERFPLNSTFKTLASAAVLARVDAGEEDLERRITFAESDLVDWSPVTEKHVGDEGMTLGELCQAALQWSDNSAANLVLDAIGGPQGLTEYMRTLGDDVTRLDRWETELNEGTPGDPRDTSTPEAMCQSLQKILLGDALSAESRQQLEDWMLGDKVADDLLRAAIPQDWRIADKTGAGGYGSRNIIAVIWPPQRQPVIAAIYLTETEASMEESNAAIADIGRALVQVITE